MCFGEVGGSEGRGGRGVAGKVVDIKRMTKNPDPEFIFPFCACGGGEGGGVSTSQSIWFLRRWFLSNFFFHIFCIMVSMANKQ